MKIAVFGAGYVGLVTGTCFAELGNNVTLVDVNETRIANLNKGIIPIYEPGLSELIKKNVEEKRINFIIDAKKAIIENEIIFIAVGTPSRNDGSTDLTYVLSVAKTIGQHMNGYKAIVDKSTVPVGTAEKVRKEIEKNLKRKIEFDIISNPEFLKEGSAIQDFMVPDRIIIGAETDKSRKIMEELYSSLARIHKPLMITDIKSAELIKYASNAMLAARISFMNQLAPLCEKVGADIKEVAKGIGLDDRIGPRFLQAGVGYGGSCFPKDVQSLVHTLKEHNLNSELINAIETTNNMQKESAIDKIHALIGDIKNKKIALWGLAFKPKTDDIREAPALTIISQLLEQGARISAFDPVAENNMKQIHKEIDYLSDMYDTIKNTDCLVIITEWDEFRNPDFEKMKKLMKGLNIVDGRNIYNPKTIREKGFKYLSVGRR